MQTPENKKKAIGVMLLGFLSFAFFFWYFKLNDTIDVKNVFLVVKSLVTVAKRVSSSGYIGVYTSTVEKNLRLRLVAH
jgi:hypothetical protein